MYHVELRERRQFGHQACSFNLSEAELRTLLEPWAREQQVEFAERKWSPHATRLTVLEGPHLPLEQLSMGRGWRNAQRQSEDVTGRVLAAPQARGGGEPRGAPDAPPLGPPTAPSTSLNVSGGFDMDLQADSLGLGILSLLEQDAAPLSRAWRLSQARFPERSASECLAVAERAIGSLLERRLIIVLHAAAGDFDDDGALSEAAAEQLEPLLRDLDSWTDAGAATVHMRRA